MKEYTIGYAIYIIRNKNAGTRNIIAAFLVDAARLLAKLLVCNCTFSLSFI
ncbi:hypothetical protein CNEO4_740017 [Clostridium neonatale]|nr:hypothetical protein CNEO_300018 [Clostridium neonatale]CAG9718258.1 hypothetical protein CNEO_670002 [Clostridium neonatale]CAI3202561.1 hypothetical protein CNEO2_270029 [Clostridium neonatale]CAI3240452.1 hypothetical protein CNEO2_360030 [Clostridium neonatale]CAI3551623.1 hypothetical protein CNEO2_190029 [Clostridium neonatale]